MLNCLHCPIDLAGIAGRECPAVARPHPRFCELADPGHPDHHPGILPFLRGEPAPPVPDPGAVPDVALALPYRPPPQPGADLPPVVARGPAPAAGPMPVGDLVAALTKRLGADRATRWIADKLGVECGCLERQQKLNALDAKVRRFLGWG